MTTLAGDRDLPALTRLHDRQARERLLHRVLPERPRLSCPRTVRHNPERRWVGVLDDPSGPPVVLRAYRRAVMPGPARAYEQLANGSPRTPPLLGWSHRHGLAAVAWVDGREVSRDLSDLDSFAAAGRALAHLHERQGVRLSPEDPLTQADAVRAAATTVATLLPDLSPEATEVARRLGADIGRCVPGSVLHGDFSADQVIRGDDGAVALIDLDGARLGEPSVDLACAAAALAETDADEPGRRALAAMYSGYESVRPLPARRRLSVLGSAHLLRKATEPFRTGSPTGPTGCASCAGSPRWRRAIALPGGSGDHGDEPARRDRPAGGQRSPPAEGHPPGSGPAEPRDPGQQPGRAHRSVAPGPGTERAVAADVEATCGAGTAWTLDHSGIVLLEPGADPRLPALRTVLRRPGAQLVAHRLERRAVVREAHGDYTKVMPPELAGRVASALFRVRIPSIAVPRLTDLDVDLGTVTTAPLPGRTFHAELGDHSVTDEDVALASKSVGAAVRELHQLAPSAALPLHDVEAELRVCRRWLTAASDHGLIPEDRWRGGWNGRARSWRGTPRRS